MTNLQELIRLVSESNKPCTSKMIIECADYMDPLISFSCTEVKYGAWKYFLPLRRSQNALVVDSSLGLDTISMVQLADSVVTVSFNRASTQALRSRFNSERLNNVTLIETSPGYLPFNDKSFDLIIVRDVDAVTMDRGYKHLHNFFKEIHRVLKSCGSVLFGSANELLLPLFRSLALYRENLGVRHGICHLKMHKADIKDVLYPLPGRYSFYEITSDRFIPFWTYNGKDIKKLFKTFILKRGIRHLAASNMYIVSRNKSESHYCFFDDLLAKIEEKYGNQSDDFIISRIIVGNPNVVICIIEGGTCKLIARIPIDEESARRVRNQVKMLSYLSCRLPERKECFPRHYRSIMVSDQEVFLEGMIEGRVIGNLGKALTEEEKLAVEWLKSFHYSTREECIVTEDDFNRLVEAPVKILKGFLKTSWEKTVLISIRDRLKAKFIGARLPMVCTHGDFKIENIVFHKKNIKINGIIDWDLGMTSGLPCIDLIYFYAYSEVLRNQQSVLSQVIFDKFCSLEGNNSEKRFTLEYLRHLGLDESWLPYFAVVSWLYHTAYRSKDLFKFWNEWYDGNISAILKQMSKVFL